MIIKLIPKTESEKEFVGPAREISLTADDISAASALFSQKATDFEIDLRLTKYKQETAKEPDAKPDARKILLSLAMLGSMRR